MGVIVFIGGRYLGVEGEVNRTPAFLNRGYLKKG